MNGQKILPFSSIIREETICDDNLGFVGVHNATCSLNFNLVKRCEHIGHVNFGSKRDIKCM